MNYLQRIKPGFYIDTYGWIAISGILVCTCSGILLAIPYDINKPFLSITSFITANPYASLVRNIHFWSAQVFLVFTLLHVYDHLKRSTEEKITRQAVWFRLTASLLFAGYIMISGFILKADADSQQARRILSTLLETIPWAGKLLQRTFIGPEGNWQILYIQHAATASIILFIAIYDHVHTLWGNLKTFLIVLVVTVLLSWFFRAPLSDLHEAAMKGPWYFVGLQEILHWISRPWIIIAGLFLIILTFFFLPQIKKGKRDWVKIALLTIVIIYLALTVIGYFFRGEDWQWNWPWVRTDVIRTAFHLHPVTFSPDDGSTIPVVTGHSEGCLVCHKGMKGLSDSHNARNTGCYSCHLGDPYSLDKNLAHKGMARVPGNLSNASKTCGTVNCHPQIASRIHTGMMATLSGMISVDRFVFGEAKSLDGLANVNDISHSGADTHLRNLCVGCHLGNEKMKTGTAAWLERGGGCNACHLTYSPSAQADLTRQLKKAKLDPSIPTIHPAINIKVTNDKCMSCHSRSGRVSMNYEGFRETALRQVPHNHSSQYKSLPDGRIFEHTASDIHFQKGMLCVDCHGSYELMGDGNYYAHKEQAVKVQCVDCHPKDKVSFSSSFEKTDRETQLIAWLRKFKTGNVKFAVTEKGKRPLVNTVIDSAGRLSLILKGSGEVVGIKKQSIACYEGISHQRLSCGTCHTSWVHQCLGCHNSYEKKTPGFDMLINKVTRGTWVEYTGKYLSDAPVLGINTKEGLHGTAVTMMPGMILTIDKGSFDKGMGNLFHRLFAPASGHTTQRQSRTCQSCHNNPLALGYGRGILSYSKSGRWSFVPLFEKNPNDGLPEDAWTGFLSESKIVSATRTGIRPFSLTEQKRILTVGACLTCHAERSEPMKLGLRNFPVALQKRSSKCILPTW